MASRKLPLGLAGQQAKAHHPSASLFVPVSSRFRPLGETVAATPRRAVFLDRDGVLIKDVHFLSEPWQLRVLSGVAEALRGLQEYFSIIVVTNQSGVARGLFSEDALEEVHRQLAKTLNSCGAVIDAIYSCPHLPGAPVEAYRQECLCRKPRPGMLLQAQQDWGIDLAASFMVGDTARDIAAGRTAGVTGMLIGGEEFASVGDAARKILSETLAA